MQRSKFLIFSLVSLLALTGCGQASKTYAASKSEGVYFTVPVGWHEISYEALNKAESKSKEEGAEEKLSLVKWQVAYSTDKKIMAKDIFTFNVTKSPVALARVRNLFPEEFNAVSYNSLRNIVVPLTEWVNNPKDDTPEYEILNDYEVVEKGARGVRTIYSFIKDGESQTVDQTAMVSSDRQTMYLFVIRCSSKCYAKNSKIITKISDSFTVRGR